MERRGGSAPLRVLPAPSGRPCLAAVLQPTV